MTQKMQNVDFSSIEECLEFLPEKEREVVDLLRDLIYDSVEGFKEKLSYNVPFYTRHYMMFFIWPSTVQWGKSKTKGVQIGFCQGYLLPDESNFLERGTRKQVYTKTFYSIEEIDIELLRSYIFDAIAADDELYRQKQAKQTS